jgi:hypothetical protein
MVKVDVHSVRDRGARARGSAVNVTLFFEIQVIDTSRNYFERQDAPQDNIIHGKRRISTSQHPYKRQMQNASSSDRLA